MTWPPDDLTYRPARPWTNTWRCGPGAAQQVIDDLELGPRVAMVWASGRVGAIGRLASPDRLRQLNPYPRPHYPQPGQRTLFDQEATG